MVNIDKKRDIATNKKFGAIAKKVIYVEKELDIAAN